MTSCSYSPSRKLSLLAPIVGTGLALAAVASAWAGPVALRAFAAVLAALLCREMLVVLRQRAAGWLAPLLAGGMPVAVGFLGIGGVAVAAGLLVPLIGAGYVWRNQPGGALSSMAADVFTAVYAGLPIAHLVLIREAIELSSGTSLIILAAVLMAGFEAGSRLGRSRGGHPLLAESPDGPTWTSAVAGIAGCAAAALGGHALLSEAIGPVAAMAMGASVGLAAACGQLAGALMAAEAGLGLRGTALPGGGGLFIAVQAALFGLPAFFFGVRLYLV